MSAGIEQWAATPGGRKLLAEARRRIEAGSALARGTLRVELTACETLRAREAGFGDAPLSAAFAAFDDLGGEDLGGEDLGEER